MKVLLGLSFGCRIDGIDCSEGLEDDGLSLLDVFYHGFAGSLWIALPNNLVQQSMRLEFVQLELLILHLATPAAAPPETSGDGRRDQFRQDSVMRRPSYHDMKFRRELGHTVVSLQRAINSR